MKLPFHLCIASALLSALVLSGRAKAVAPEIKDEGKFFSADALKKANEDIRTIARKFDKDLLIETYLTVPGDQVEKVKALSSEERRKFFHTWAEDRIETTVVHGVYVLICKNPPHIQVEVSPKARVMFTNAMRDKLAEQLLKQFRDKKFDEGLHDAVQFVREKLADNAKK